MADHDHERRLAFSGVCGESLAADGAAWVEVGEAIAALARLVVRRCRESAFLFGAANAVELGARIADAVDEPFDAPAHAVVAAAARRALNAA